MTHVIFWDQVSIATHFSISICQESIKVIYFIIFWEDENNFKELFTRRIC